jgi:hypothetical protein
MPTTEQNKCAHPPCGCTPKSGKYCSVQCEAMETTPNVDIGVGRERKQSTSPALYFLASDLLSRPAILAQ